MPHSTRDEFVRQLWIAGFELLEDLPTAHLFERLSDHARVLVPKRGPMRLEMPPAEDEPAPVIDSNRDRFTSPCCQADSRLRRIRHGVIYFRCSACTHYWDRPAARRHVLRIVT